MKKARVRLTFGFILALAALIGVAGSLTGCSKPESEAPFVVRSSTQPAGERPTVTPGHESTTSVTTRITFRKASILGTEFLYGSDLQFSSEFDKEYEVYNQTMALGHVPVTFRVVGRELQLIADQRRLYPSNANHPEELVARFPIVSETADELEVQSMDSRLYLTSQVGKKSDRPGDLWVRSFQFDSTDQVLLQETSLRLADGRIYEMTESLMPTTRIAPGSDFTKFEMNPEDPTGGFEGTLSRFRLLAGESIFDGERKFAFAQHYDLSNAATIDWYATSNTPDEYLPAIKTAVEGWNRYFRTFKKINRDVVRFLGKLPAGRVLGDPRLNVISWDSRLVAGAAYETQAVDPRTGKQSHSLIYLPAAWLQIGKDYWTDGRYADPSIRPKRGGDSKLARVTCRRDMVAIRDRLMSESAATYEPFAVDLLKQTLFHEVGHALGLAHNFKGSLSFDRSNPKSLFSTSIMDYNDYEIERGAFTDTASADGPLLEYDRQALSVIYNKGADIAVTDPELPVCADEEADQLQGGVDPLCIRYDSEKDPTFSIRTAFARVENSKVSGDVSALEAVERAGAAVIATDRLEKIKYEPEFDALMMELAARVNGTLRFYFVSGKASVSRSIRNNLRSLLEFAPEILPEPGPTELGLRTRLMDGVKKALALRALPAVLKTPIQAWIQNDLPTALATTPFLVGLSVDDRAAKLKEVQGLLLKALTAFESNEKNGIARIRVAVLTELARQKEVAYFLGELDGKLFDFESEVTQMLIDIVSDPSRLPGERRAAAASIASFEGRLGMKTKLATVRTVLETQLAGAKKNSDRELLVEILDALAGKNES